MEPRSERRKWTDAEDAILRSEVEAQKESGPSMNWAAIATKLPGRSNKDCRKRWSKSVEGGRKGIWGEDEDQRLINAVAVCGTRWTQVAQHVGTRHADQCAKRWQHSLDPNVNRSDWTQQEDDALFMAVSEIGRNWRQIASTILPGRSTTHLKNRYELICRRRQEQNQAGNRSFSTDSESPDLEDGSPASKSGQTSPRALNPPLDSQPHNNFFVSPTVSLDTDLASDFMNLPNSHLGSISQSSEQSHMNSPISSGGVQRPFINTAFPPTTMAESLNGPYPPSASIWSHPSNEQLQLINVDSCGTQDMMDMDEMNDFSSTFGSTPSSLCENSEHTILKGAVPDGTLPNWTLILEGIEADTVGFICDSLMRKNVRLDMKLQQNYG